MKRLTLHELGNLGPEIEAAVDATPEIDRWCSGPDWVIPVNLGFAPRSSHLLWRVDTGSSVGFILLARYLLADGRTMIGGMEPLWGFASPLLGDDVETIAGALATTLAADRSWDLLLLPGMPEPTGPGSFLPRVIRSVGHLGRTRVGHGIVRQVADLTGGYDAWLARRPARFRRNLRQASRRAEDVGLTYHDHSHDPDVFERILAIEHDSWKGRDGSGITSSEMSATYGVMVERLRVAGRLRAHVARVGDEEVGYVIGGVRARIYRGLQLSYRPSARHLSVGHLLQHHQLQLLDRCDEADRYDLGMDMPYKQRWADTAHPTLTVVIERAD